MAHGGWGSVRRGTGAHGGCMGEVFLSIWIRINYVNIFLQGMLTAAHTGGVAQNGYYL